MNSECSHSTASAIHLAGPYVKQDTAVGGWCHNPQAVQLKDKSWALFHLGEGVPTHHPENYTGGRVPANESSPRRMAGEMRRRWRTREPPSMIHASRSLDGPWAPVPPAASPAAGGSPLRACNNPAPLVYSRGFEMF